MFVDPEAIDWSAGALTTLVNSSAKMILLDKLLVRSLKGSFQRDGAVVVWQDLPTAVSFFFGGLQAPRYQPPRPDFLADGAHARHTCPLLEGRHSLVCCA